MICTAYKCKDLEWKHQCKTYLTTFTVKQNLLKQFQKDKKQFLQYSCVPKLCDNNCRLCNKAQCDAISGQNALNKSFVKFELYQFCTSRPDLFGQLRILCIRRACAQPAVRVIFACRRHVLRDRQINASLSPLL